eukprot:NODE_14088_length_1129_cov_6.001996.p1 GENE.NODE_14088_length_1129_cov_6.001996~~NODE_14088_length_1129_cov_6.001996.p1  ORF type:complete len:301 (+),score=69.75 NODE_14088_length_1129_cov_6.001996:95-904(+)
MGQRGSVVLRSCALDGPVHVADGALAASLEQLHATTDQILYDRVVEQVGISGHSFLCEGEDTKAVYKCCSTHREAPEVGVDAAIVEALRHSPRHFEELETMDLERSHVRYANTFQNQKPGRNQRQGVTLDEWLHCAAGGREILLLTSAPQPIEKLIPVSCKRIPAVYTLDPAFTKLTIRPKECPPIVIPVVDILVICPAADFEPLFDHDVAVLSELELERAVLLQYVAEGSNYKCICFLEKSAFAADSFADAVTALWLEKRCPARALPA